MAQVNERIHQNYIKNHLIAEIVNKFENEDLVDYKIEHANGLDGFMSALYNLQLQTKTTEGKTKERLLLLKFMRGEESFRVSSNSYIQCANEVYIYAEVLPAYAQLLAAAKIKQINVSDWVPHTYKAQFGYIEGLSSSAQSPESVLALENLKPLGYRLSSNVLLPFNELLLMCKPLAQYHAMCYALRLIDPKKLLNLQAGIKPLYFHRDVPEDLKNNIFRVLHNLGFERFYDFYDRKLNGELPDDKFKLYLQKLRARYGAAPTRLLEYLRVSINNQAEDARFGTILHGDFNRNNVLFHYNAVTDGQQQQANDAKMIDFQELRYGSPALDLSFFMYMNIPANKRNEWWLTILKTYHSHLLDTLTQVLNGYNLNVQVLPNLNEFLANYSFENFYAHFSKFAFYGVIICMHYLPWLVCEKAECALLSSLFEKDMHSAEFRRISIDAGGDAANYQIMNVIKHACEMGYMEFVN